MIRIPIRCSGTDLVTIFQSIFFNSLYEDVTKEINFLKIFCLAIISSRKKQARRDSNPQHAVLETAALPVGATGLNIRKLFYLGFRMNSMLATKFTIFLKRKFIRCVFFIFVCSIIFITTHIAL